MRIAAGIILIVAAIINVIAGAGYVLGGGVTAAVGVGLEEGTKAVTDEAVKEGATTADEAAKANEEVAKAASTAKTAGGIWLVFGLVLWLMFLLQIVCSVFLFIAKAKGFVLVVAVLSVAVEIFGILQTAFGWTNIIGILGGLLAFIGGMGIGKKAAGPAPAAPAPAA